MLRKILVPYVDQAPRRRVTYVWSPGPRPLADGTVAKPVDGSEPNPPQTALRRQRAVMREAGITPFASAGAGATESPVTSRPVTYEDLYRQLRRVKQWPGRCG